MIQFGELSVTDQFSTWHHGREIVFEKTGCTKAKVTHDPRGVYVGQEFRFGLYARCTPRRMKVAVV